MSLIVRNNTKPKFIYFKKYISNYNIIFKHIFGLHYRNISNEWDYHQDTWTIPIVSKVIKLCELFLNLNFFFKKRNIKWQKTSRNNLWKIEQNLIYKCKNIYKVQPKRKSRVWGCQICSIQMLITIHSLK